MKKAALPKEVEDALLRGYSVLPMNARKKPLVKWKEYQERQTTRDEVLEWVKQFGSAIKGWGRVTGQRAKLVVLDDDKAGWFEAWGLRPHIRTGSGGYHWVGQHPGWNVRTQNSKSSKKLGETFAGLDIRGDGGYSLICGFNEAGGYTWLREPEPDPLNVLPQEVLSFFGLLEPPKKKTIKTVESIKSAERFPIDVLVTRALEEARLAGRNSAGFWLACQLRDNGYTEAEAEQAGSRYVTKTGNVNMKGKTEQYSLDDFIVSIQQAWTRPAREPLTVKDTTERRVHHRDVMLDPETGEIVLIGEKDKPQQRLVSYALTDYGNAEWLVARFGTMLRHCYGLGWYIWDGRRWKRTLKGEVERCAKDTIRHILNLAVDLDAEDSRHRREELIKHALRSEAAPRLTAMMTLAETEMGVRILADELDTDPWVLNCDNGLLDLRTGKLRPHDCTVLCSKITLVPYMPGAQCPRFLKFLGEVFVADEELIGYAKRAVGYSLTGDVNEQVLFFLHGLGANGKSTLLTILEELLGEYAGQAAPGLLLERQHEGHPTEIADLMGKRLVISNEVGEGKRLAEELVKRLTGEKRLKGRFMRQDFVEFPVLFKLWLAANHKPIIRGTDRAIWRRIPLIPFSVTFKDAEEAEQGEPVKDTGLLDDLRAELPGILAWAVQGCLEWQRCGLKPPEAIREATEAYRSEMDALGDFLEDCCEEGNGFSVSNPELWQSYEGWCQANGERYLLGRKQFSQQLTDRGFVQMRGEQRAWGGLQLKPLAEMPAHGARERFS